MIKSGRSWILWRISKSYELDSRTKTKRKVLRPHRWPFPCRLMGTLARQNHLLFKIQLQQKIHPILHRCCNFIYNQRDVSSLEITFSSETEKEVIMFFSTTFVSTITYSELTFNHWLITLTSWTESSPNNKLNSSTTELLASDPTSIFQTESGFTIQNSTLKKNSKEESDLPQMLHGPILILLTQ